MPNLCINRIKASGPAEAIAEFASNCVPLHFFDQVIPIPDHLKKADEETLRNWKIENWGATYIEDFQTHVYEKTSIEMTFVTPWDTPRPIFREMAKRHPQVAFRVTAYETGLEVSYIMTSQDGVIHEEEPGLTEELITEVDGESPKIDEYYLEPAKLIDPPATDPYFLIIMREVESALEGYPVYNPPHHGIEMAMPEEHARDNFDYFMCQREGRVEYLRTFLSSFDVTLHFDEQGKQPLDEWFAKYAGFLFVHEEGSSFLTHMPPWTGPRSGLNVIFDLAILLGEFATRENPFLYWEMYTDVPTGMRKTDEEYQKPVLAGHKTNPQWRFYIIRDLYDACRSLRKMTYLRRKPWFSIFKRQERLSLSRIHTQFFSRKLKQIHFIAHGDIASANAALNAD